MALHAVSDKPEHCGVLELFELSWLLHSFVGSEDILEAFSGTTFTYTEDERSMVGRLHYGQVLDWCVIPDDDHFPFPIF